MKTAARLTLLGVALALTATLGGATIASGKSQATIHFSFHGYANNVNILTNHWTATRSPSFVQGWTNEDGDERTSPHFGGPPNGGQWAIVRISS